MVDGILVHRLISTDHGLDISYSRNYNVLPYIGSQSCVGIFSTTSMSGVHLQANKKPAQLPCIHSCLQMNKQEIYTLAMHPLLLTDEQTRNLHTCHASTLAYR